jgi:hypothetical protein
MMGFLRMADLRRMNGELKSFYGKSGKKSGKIQGLNQTATSGKKFQSPGNKMRQQGKQSDYISVFLQ